MKKETLYYKIMKGIAKILFPKPKFTYETLPEENSPAVYLCNHAGMQGPCYASLYFDEPKTIWLINFILNKEKNADFIFDDFFFGRRFKHKGFMRLLAKILAKILYPVLKATDHICVYHDQKVLNTFRESVSALKEGKSIVIFPECPTRFSPFVHDFYSGFADIARIYYNDTGKALKFYPTYVCHDLHKICVGNPIEYQPTVHPKKQRTIISDYARDKIHEMASSLPKHKVVPFLPPVWYEYYGEFENDHAGYWRLFE